MCPNAQNLLMSITNCRFPVTNYKRFYMSCGYLWTIGQYCAEWLSRVSPHPLGLSGPDRQFDLLYPAYCLFLKNIFITGKQANSSLLCASRHFLLAIFHSIASASSRSDDMDGGKAEKYRAEPSGVYYSNPLTFFCFLLLFSFCLPSSNFFSFLLLFLPPLTRLHLR